LYRILHRASTNEQDIASPVAVLIVMSQELVAGQRWDAWQALRLDLPTTSPCIGRCVHILVLQIARGVVVLFHLRFEYK